MYKIFQTDFCVVYDDVMNSDEFTQVWRYTQAENYSIPHVSGWSKVWRTTDGMPLGGTQYDANKAPFGNSMDLANHYIKETSKLHPELIGEYEKLWLRSYIYPRGTKLSWHNDKGYSAAAIFYTHTYWGSTWGGELLLAKTQEIDAVPPPCLDHTFEDSLISQYGHGSYITPKPNRLVITKGGIWHQINRVDEDAGDHCRTSIVGFFTKGS
jgi:hypothetical protein